MDELIKSFTELKCSLSDLSKRTQRALGFTKTFEYKQIFFHVGPRVVVADLSPLAYVDLVQEIGDDGVQNAIICLYERLSPLLECNHTWLDLSPSTRSQILNLDSALSLGGSRIRTCPDCGAYGLESADVALPGCGREMRTAIEIFQTGTDSNTSISAGGNLL